MTSPRSSSAAGAQWVAAGILLSRLSGLVRQSLVAYFFGASFLADTWKAALRIPNILQNLLGEGSLSASFVPVYAGMVERGQEGEARRFASAVLALLMAVAGGLALLGVVAAPWIVHLLVPSWSVEHKAATTALVRVLFPMTGILVLSAWALGILNAHRRYLVSYTAPVAWNLAIIATLGGFGWGRGLRGSELLMLAGWGALLGGVAQFAVQLPALWRIIGRPSPRWDLGAPGVREAVRNFFPVVSARGVINLSRFFELWLVGFLAEGALATLDFAQTLYILPVSIFGMSVATAQLTELSRAQGDDRHSQIGPAVRGGLELVGFWVVPATLGYLFLGEHVVGLIFQAGAFGELQTLGTYAVLAALSLGLLASTGSRALSSAFYALGDTRTPARLAYLRVVLSLAAAAALMVPLDSVDIGGLRLGAVGIALGTTGAAWVERLLLGRALRARIGAFAPTRARLLRTWAAAVGALVPAVLVGSLVESLPVKAEAALILATYGFAYLGLARAAGLPLPLPRRGASAPSSPSDG